MKKFAGIFVLLLLVAFPVQAQSASKVKFYLTSGIVVPVSSYNYDNFSGNRLPGFSLGAGVGYALTPRSSVVVQYEYTRFLYKKNTYSTIDQQIEADIYSNRNLKRTVAIKGLYKFTIIPDRPLAVPYLIAGVGAIQITDRDGMLIVSPNETVRIETTSRYWDAILAFGGGFNIKLRPQWSLTLEARFDIVPSKYDPVQFTPIKVGLEF